MRNRLVAASTKATLVGEETMPKLWVIVVSVK